ncbi:aryl hydrocarbon receptor-like isoform X2 [Ptychodera flava]|uniref:aryl hydrocarbon receptor-like isoform X2 n=1 Tax=Ptychodera flava TaxID=63121 RepID=UPI00396A1C78
MYAGRKRRRPVKRIPPNQGNVEVKSNPSKRHRDRLNKELDNLASLLPFEEDVIAKLDKLSILRLSVSYLRNKSFFQKVTPSYAGNKTISIANKDCYGNPSKTIPTIQQNGTLVEGEREMLLQALNGFVLVVASDGIIFYASPTIHDFLGFHQSDVMNQSVYEIIHTEDRNEFRRQLNHDFMMNAETHGSSSDILHSTESNSAIQMQEPTLSSERNFVTRFRCLLDNSSGFLALHFTGRVKVLHGQRRRHEDTGVVVEDHAPVGLFALACPLQPPSIIEIHTRNIIFRTKHKLDFKPISIDPRGIDYLGYNEREFSSETAYNMLHYEDLLYTAEQHGSLLKKGETGFIYFRLMTKHGSWLWVQAKGRVIFKNSKPDYIISTHRPMSDDEGTQHLTQRGSFRKFPFSGQSVLYNCNEPPRPPFIPPGADLPFPPAGDRLPNGRGQSKMSECFPHMKASNGSYLPNYEDCAVKVENMCFNADNTCTDQTLHTPMITDASPNHVTMATGMQEHDYRMGTQGYYGNAYSYSYSNDGFSYRNFYSTQQYSQDEHYNGDRHQTQNSFVQPLQGGLMIPTDSMMSSMHMNFYNTPNYRANNSEATGSPSANHQQDQNLVAMETRGQNVTPGTANQMSACQYQQVGFEDSKSGGSYTGDINSPASLPVKSTSEKCKSSSPSDGETLKGNSQYGYSSCCVNKSTNTVGSVWTTEKLPACADTYPSGYSNSVPYMQITASDGQCYANTPRETVEYSNQSLSSCTPELGTACNYGNTDTDTGSSTLTQPLISFSALADTLLGEK